MPQEDTSAIWIEPKIEASDSLRITNGKRKKKNLVLIVDDDADTLFTVGEMVKQIGCDVSFAKNGLECLTSLKALKPELIFA